MLKKPCVKLISPGRQLHVSSRLFAASEPGVSLSRETAPAIMEPRASCARLRPVPVQNRGGSGDRTTDRQPGRPACALVPFGLSPVLPPQRLTWAARAQFTLYVTNCEASCVLHGSFLWFQAKPPGSGATRDGQACCCAGNFAHHGGDFRALAGDNHRGQSIFSRQCVLRR